MITNFGTLMHYSFAQKAVAPQKIDRTARASTAELQARVDRQNMVIQTLLMLLMEKKVFNEAEFTQWVDWVDSLDGKVDGKLTEDNRPIECSNCHRMNPSTARKCQYCNRDLPVQVIDRRDKKSD